MASASGLSVREITAAADGLLTEDALRTASVELVNFASKLPMAAVYGTGDTCSADGIRFYVPVNILAADYSHLLGGRGVNMYVHTTDTSLRLYQQAIPVRLREASVKAPLAWPNSSDSTSSVGIAPQLTTTNGPSARGLS